MVSISNWINHVEMKNRALHVAESTEIRKVLILFVQVIKFYYSLMMI